MKYLLDTNVCIRLLKGLPESVLQRFDEIQNQDIVIPSIVRFELYYGACKSARKDHTMRVLNDFLSRYKTLPFDDLASVCCGEIRADLDKQGAPIGPYDLIIASIALSRDLTLVTHNIKEFSRVPNLNFEDWELPLTTRISPM
ncbi:MAG: type II toxin-antitoxin system VapC family toxin [Candidatus Ozemobacteraceae bacterium]